MCQITNKDTKGTAEQRLQRIKHVEFRVVALNLGYYHAEGKIINKAANQYTNN